MMGGAETVPSRPNERQDTGFGWRKKKRRRRQDKGGGTRLRGERTELGGCQGCGYQCTFNRLRLTGERPRETKIRGGLAEIGR